MKARTKRNIWITVGVILALALIGFALFLYAIARAVTNADGGRNAADQLAAARP